MRHGKHNKGEFPQAAKFFYDVTRPSLNEIADESTGDTQQELRRLYGISDWLFTSGFLPKDGTISYGDFGSGNGLRILLPYLQWCRSQGITFKNVDAIDLLDWPDAPNDQWHAMQADLSDPELQLNDENGNPKKYHLITASWSLITDFYYDDQLKLINIISRHLEPGGIAVLDFPTFESYLPLVIENKKNHPEEKWGTFEKEFNLPDGTTVKKKFYAAPTEDVPVQFAKAGLRFLTEYAPGKESNIPNVSTRWIGRNKNERITLIVQKEGEDEGWMLELFGSALAPARESGLEQV